MVAGPIAADVTLPNDDRWVRFEVTLEARPDCLREAEVAARVRGRDDPAVVAGEGARLSSGEPARPVSLEDALLVALEDALLVALEDALLLARDDRLLDSVPLRAELE